MFTHFLKPHFDDPNDYNVVSLVSHGMIRFFPKSMEFKLFLESLKKRRKNTFIDFYEPRNSFMFFKVLNDFFFLLSHIYVMSS